MDINQPIKIDILCPNPRCSKCKRMLKMAEEVRQSLGEMAIITLFEKPAGWMRYKTWIAPALFINEIPVARGYVLEKRQIMKIISTVIVNRVKKLSL